MENAMENLLRPTKTRRLSGSRPLLAPVSMPESAQTRGDLAVRSADDVIEVLLSKPDLNALTKCLKWLTSKNDDGSHFNINIPGPQAARIISILVNDIIPNFWHVLQEKADPVNIKRRRMLVTCLVNVAGIGAMINQLRSLVVVSKGTQKKHEKVSQPSSALQSIQELLDVLETLFQKDDFIERVWHTISVSIEQSIKRNLLWKEFVSFLASGKLLSAVAEANDICNELRSDVQKGSWIGDGPLYSRWFGRSILYMITKNIENDVEKSKAMTLLLSKALTLGYTDKIVETVFNKVLHGDDQNLPQVRLLLYGLAPHEQKTILYSLLRLTARPSVASSEAEKPVSGVAALLHAFTEERPNLREALIDWLTSSNGGAIGSDPQTRRAVIATLSIHPELLQKTFMRVLQQFGDKLYIKHAPVLSQEVNCQIFLLLAGRLYRSDPDFLRKTSQSSLYINAISNRLAAASSRSRFLGMIVGVAVSDLVDQSDKKMTFSSEEIDNDEGRWLRSLTKVMDSIGSISDLMATTIDSPAPKKRIQRPRSPVQQSKLASVSKIMSIEEIDDTSDDEALPMYEKPDSDDEDSEDDPTLVQRDKPTAPVYIRDLIAGLRDDENYDRHRLALTTASTLIRRKTGFGTEVTDHIEELATRLVGLNDKYNLEKFQEMRLQAMIAVLVAQPLEMGQWFSRTYFNGEYSMGQRAAILTTLGLGARELAGYREEDAALTGTNALPEKLFPSKQLPEKLHKIYAIDAAPVDNLAHRLERTILQPMANEAADKITGPNILKVRTFSSRMEVEKKRKRPITNQLAKAVADGFFFPLTGLWRIQAKTRGKNNVFSQPFLLSHFLKTLSLMLNASGASTLSLPALTTEFWSLLLSLRVAAQDAPPVLEALLFSFLTLLEINNDNQRGIAEDHAKELLETQAWVEQVFEIVGGGSEEGDRMRMLAAGVLVKTREVVEKYQRLLLGDLVNFT